jgi:hypothetical protein
MKKFAKVLLYFFWFLIVGCWNSLLTSCNPKNNTVDVSPAFLEHGLAEKRSQFELMQTMIQTSKRLDSFLHEAAQNFELPLNTVVGSIGVMNAVVSDVLTFPLLLLLLLLLILQLLFLLLIFFVML